eukprot:TRINITY_DN8826_c0_g1_i1.p1 TRINITY_DN8826_c0_g1~~TRINITY_DN8826_c0_g1_i1.p1  ORF type:complete len:500 (+),score=177.47 TRINITY_DN8826_c0_g1_i1:106-1605(+)
MREFAWLLLLSISTVVAGSTGLKAPLFQPPRFLLKTADCSATMATVISARPPPNQRNFVSVAIDNLISNYTSRMKDPQLAALFENCLPNTLDTTVEFATDAAGPDTFVITGDIEAMWFRDSTNQVLPYVPFVNEDAALDELIRGVINRQVANVLYDPYANAYNKDNDGSPWMTDNTYKIGFLGVQVPGMTFHIHERKYELDSLCAVLKLSWEYYNVSGNLAFFNSSTWQNAVASIVQVITAFQAGSEEGSLPYYFQRQASNPTDTLMHGIGSPARRTGMSQSPFRPSDDASALPFPIAANAMAVVTLNQVSSMLTKLGNEALAQQASALASTIQAGIQKFGVQTHPTHGQIYAFEVDGYGSSYFMDDANVPSLLSLPYLGFCDKSDPTYLNTRQFLLSADNPYFFSGSAGEGIGGPHIGPDFIWPMSIIMRALTSTSDAEIAACLDTLKSTTAGTGFMHESFNKNDATSFTRPWFAWANTLFGELIITLAKERPYLIFG